MGGLPGQLKHVLSVGQRRLGFHPVVPGLSPVESPGLKEGPVLLIEPDADAWLGAETLGEILEGLDLGGVKVDRIPPPEDFASTA